MCVCKRFEKVFETWRYKRASVEILFEGDGSTGHNSVSPDQLFQSMVASPTVRRLARYIPSLTIYFEPPQADSRIGLSNHQFEWILSHLTPRTLLFTSPVPDIAPLPEHFATVLHLLEANLQADHLDTMESYGLPESIRLPPPTGLLSRVCTTLTSLYLAPNVLAATQEMPHLPHLTDIRFVVLGQSARSNFDFACAIIRQAPKLLEMQLEVHWDIEGPHEAASTNRQAVQHRWRSAPRPAAHSSSRGCLHLSGVLSRLSGLRGGAKLRHRRLPHRMGS